MTPIHDLVLLAILAGLWIGPATLVARAAAERGGNYRGFLVASLIIPWPIMFFVAMLLRGPAAGVSENPPTDGRRDR